METTNIPSASVRKIMCAVLKDKDMTDSDSIYTVALLLKEFKVDV